jgi:hypothetical protein
MKATTRSKLDMGDRALNFSRAHPDPSAGYAATLASLEECLTRARQLAQIHEDGINRRKAANARKDELRRQMSRSQLRHLARVAKVAMKEIPELSGKLVLPPGQRPYRSFRALAGTMLAEAQTQKELLVKYGLTETVLDSLVQSLEQFDRAVIEGTEALRAHVSARAELDVLGDDVVAKMRVMDALNRFRFATDRPVLAEWQSVSNIIGPARPVENEPQPLPTGQERPAA